jgi:hypothetical protein
MILIYLPINLYESSPQDILNYLSKDNTSVIPMLFISFPSAKDPLWETKHPGKSTATIVTFANYSWFEKWEENRVMHRGIVDISMSIYLPRYLSVYLIIYLSI